MLASQVGLTLWPCCRVNKKHISVTACRYYVVRSVASHQLVNSYVCTALLEVNALRAECEDRNRFVATRMCGLTNSLSVHSLITSLYEWGLQLGGEKLAASHTFVFTSVRMYLMLACCILCLCYNDAISHYNKQGTAISNKLVAGMEQINGFGNMLAFLQRRHCIVMELQPESI